MDPVILDLIFIFSIISFIMFTKIVSIANDVDKMQKDLEKTKNKVFNILTIQEILNTPTEITDRLLKENREYFFQLYKNKKGG